MRKLCILFFLFFSSCSPLSKNNASTPGKLSAKAGIRLVVGANQSKELVRKLVLKKFEEKNITLVGDAEYEVELHRHNVEVARLYKNRPQDFEKTFDEEMSIDHLILTYTIRQYEKGISVDSVRYKITRAPLSLHKDKILLKTDGFPDRSLSAVTDSIINKFVDINPRN